MDSTDEIEAMKSVSDALAKLDEPARLRVMAWTFSRFGGDAALPRPPAPGALGAPNGAPHHETLAEFFDAFGAESDADRALAVGYWLQIHEQMAQFDSARVNRELKQLGYAVGNITQAFTALSALKPALAVQMAKSGKAQQARKQYKITKAGEKAVEARLGRSPE